jgi:carbon-monoxide dehydrogenase medium subunit
VLEGWPALAGCLRLVANERVRNQATIGGVLADADYASDPPALLSALAAEAVLAGPDGRRAVPVRDLIVDHYTTVIEPDELLVEVRVPPQPAVAAYRKFRSRHAEDRPCVGVALAAGRDDAGRVRDLRLVVGAVSGRPQELPEACALAEGRVLDEALAAEIARRYAAELDPIDDARGSSAYRRRIVEVEVRRALAGVAA